jgi:hypothetical protein
MRGWHVVLVWLVCASVCICSLVVLVGQIAAVLEAVNVTYVDLMLVRYRSGIVEGQSSERERESSFTAGVGLAPSPLERLL